MVLSGGSARVKILRGPSCLVALGEPFLDIIERREPIGAVWRNALGGMVVDIDDEIEPAAWRSGDASPALSQRDLRAGILPSRAILYFELA